MQAYPVFWKASPGVWILPKPRDNASMDISVCLIFHLYYVTNKGQIQKYWSRKLLYFLRINQTTPRLTHISRFIIGSIANVLSLYSKLYIPVMCKIQWGASLSNDLVAILPCVSAPAYPLVLKGELAHYIWTIFDSCLFQTRWSCHFVIFLSTFLFKTINLWPL